MNAKDRYKDFHGKGYRRVSAVNLHMPRQLVLLGRAVAIEYECDKLKGGGDGKKAIYRHEFETPAMVCMDERGKKQLYIIGKDIFVDEAGIQK